MTPAEIRRARSTQRYQNGRARFLSSNPLCRGCLDDGRTVAAVELDHRVPISDGGAFWDRENWQGLCRECHEAKTAVENRLDETPERAAWRKRMEGMT